MGDGVQLTTSDFATTAIITRILKKDIFTTIILSCMQYWQHNFWSVRSYVQFYESKQPNLITFILYGYVSNEYEAMVMLLPPYHFYLMIITITSSKLMVNVHIDAKTQSLCVGIYCHPLNYNIIWTCISYCMPIIISVAQEKPLQYIINLLYEGWAYLPDYN